MRTKPLRAHAAAQARPAANGERSPAARRRYVDNLKVLLIAAIIAGHAVAGYSEFEFWSYAEMREVELSSVTQGLLLWLVGPLVLVLIPLLFLVAGLLTPASVDRHGRAAYVRSRLLRLGVPFVAYVLLIQPLVMYPVHPPGEAAGSYWYELVGAGDDTLDTGPLWFVGTLLVFSLGYVAWTSLVSSHPSRGVAPRLGVRRLLALVLPVAAATYLIRVAVPFGQGNPGVSLNVWEWPACLTLFVLGIVVSGQGWLDELPAALWRRARAVALGGVAGMVGFVALAVALDADEDQWWGGGWHWTSFGWSFFEVLIGVFGALWVLGSAQRHLDRPLRGVGPPVSRSAYGAFMLQTPVLIGLAFTLRPVPVPAELKALAVAALGVAVSFGLARILVERVPGVRRVL